MPNRFRPTWTGVRTKPQGTPHQPKTTLKTVPASWPFNPQLRQHICGVLLHEVTNTADQTLWLTCTSTGPGRLHFGQRP